MPADHQVLVEAEAVCVQAVRQAGAVLLEYFRQPLTVEFKEKGQQSPVTEADRRSEELLRAALSQAFPEHGIIGEEAKDAVNPSADYVWFLDPLDGTFPKPPVPRPSPCGTPLSPPLPRPAAYVQHQEWSAVWHSAWLRGARAEPWAWRGRRQVALGGFRGHAPGALAQKCRLFFLSALRTIIFPLALSQ